MDPIAQATQTPAPQTPVSAPVPQISPAGSFDGPVALTKFAWKMFTKNWKTLGLIMLVPIVLYVAGMLLMITKSSAGSVIGFILIIAEYVFFIAAIPASIQAVHRLTVEPNTPVSVKSQYKFGFSIFWSFILLMIIMGAVNMGSSVLLVIPGIVVMVYAVFSYYTLTIDGKRNFAALTESFSLIRGRWWKVFGRLLFSCLIGLVVYIVAVLVALVLSLLPEVLAIILGVILALAVAVFGWTFGIAYFYRLYVSLKESRSANVPTGTFKGWLIAFLCIGVISPLILIPIMSAVVLTSLNSARMKGLEAQQNAQGRMVEIQRMIDAENLKSMQQGTSVPVQQ
jgi:hypothetical protein